MRFILALFFFISSYALSAQLNPQHIYVDATTNVLEELNINSLLKPVPVSYDSTIPDSLGASLAGTNLYKVDFESKPAFIGDFEVVFEYTEPSFIPGIPQTNYTTIHYRVNTSEVDANYDYALSDGSSQSIYPLSNDSSTDGPLTLVKLGHISGGTANIISDDAIEFDLDSESGSILYFAEDSLGTVSSSLVHIVSEDNSKTDDQELFVDNHDAIELVLPSSEFTVLNDASNGSLSQTTIAFVWTYTPNQDYSGTDAFSFSSSAGGLLEYDVNVLDKQTSNSFLVADEIFIPTNGTVSFDVLENDFKSDYDVFYFSPDLTELGNGLYEYSPAQGFTGDLVFEYKVFTGLQLFTQDILIHVSDFAPTTQETYAFELIQDQPIRLTHNTPTGAYTFYNSIDPAHGSLVILDANGEEVTACDTLTGENTIVYTPDSGYAGTDEFDIEYCIGSNPCEIVKVDINVLSSSHTDCLCLEDCVFEGDHNDDGRVDIKDILDLGLNIGEGGSVRTEDFTQTWTGQFSNNWGFDQLGSSVDLKCGDADGDSYIDEYDLSVIEQHYGKLSKFQTAISSAISDVPVYFVPQQTEVDSGDLLVIDIIVGDANYPPIDMHGLAFSFNMNPEWMDSSSVNFYLYDDNWLSYNSPTKDFQYVPQDGQVDIAVTRFSKGSADGFGVIGAIEFIVEDEVQGLKRSSAEAASLVLEMSNIISVNEYGKYSSHPSIRERVQSSSEDETQDYGLTERSVVTFPNPTTGLVNISSKKALDKIEVIDAQGRLLQTHRTIDLTPYDTGVYFLRLHSQDEILTKKITKLSL